MAPSSFRIHDHTACSWLAVICGRSPLKCGTGRKFAKQGSLPQRCHRCGVTVNLISVAEIWAQFRDFPPLYWVYWMENCIRPTLDRYRILAWSPEGWSHGLQTATLEGHHTVVAEEVCRGREAIKHLFSLLLINNNITTTLMLMVRIYHLKGHTTVSMRRTKTKRLNHVKV